MRIIIYLWFLLTTNPDNFFSDEDGLYVIGQNGVTGYCMDDPVNWNQDWERPVNFEYFTKDGEQEVNQLVGSKIFGGCSRMFRYKSLAIIARNNMETIGWNINFSNKRGR